MIRRTRPKRIVEIGSGNSSGMILDTNEQWFGNAIECTFVEPYPRLFELNLKAGDAQRIEVHASRVQDVPIEVFSSLEEGDILFVDSTHVSKVGGDVNHIFFEILPKIGSGVIVHFQRSYFEANMPLCLRNPGGSLWLRKR
jgi:hypothetical protein